MRICDRCGTRQLKMRITDKQNGNEWDLCHVCAEKFMEFIAPLPQEPVIEEVVEEVEVKKRGRKPKSASDYTEKEK